MLVTLLHGKKLRFNMFAQNVPNSDSQLVEWLLSHDLIMLPSSKKLKSDTAVGSTGMRMGIVFVKAQCF